MLVVPFVYEGYLKEGKKVTNTAFIGPEYLGCPVSAPCLPSVDISGLVGTAAPEPSLRTPSRLDDDEFLHHGRPVPKGVQLRRRALSIYQRHTLRVAEDWRLRARHGGGDVPDVSRAGGRVAGAGGDVAGCDVLAVEGALVDGVGGLGLVVGCLVACAVELGEGEAGCLAGVAGAGAGDEEVGVAGGGEGGGAEGEGEGLAADPGAAEVAVAVDEVDGDVGGEEGGELWGEGPDEVAGPDEVEGRESVDDGGAGCVVYAGSKAGLGRRTVEEAKGIGRWEMCGGVLCDVEGMELGEFNISYNLKWKLCFVRAETTHPCFSARHISGLASKGSEEAGVVNVRLVAPAFRVKLVSNGTASGDQVGTATRAVVLCLEACSLLGSKDLDAVGVVDGEFEPGRGLDL